MMQILLPIAIGLSAFFFSKSIRLNSTIIYIFALLIAGLSILIPTSEISTFISSGTLGLSFLIIVMYTGALSKGSLLKKKLRSVRKEFVILGFIFISPHAYLYIYEFIFGNIPLQLFGLLAYIIMIPLFIISFNFFKSKMKISVWIRLQRWSYLVYFLIFIHSMNVASLSNVFIYLFIFTSYLFLKLYYYVFTTYQLAKSIAVTCVVGCLGIVIATDITAFNDEPYNILENNEFTNGVYTGVYEGYHNIDVIVEVAITDNTIERISIYECGCTPSSGDGKYLDAAYEIANEIVIQNRTDIDAINGATITSDAVSLAVIEALEKAKIK